jgi:vitamin-K-epoxide reductase (warfarin-sensitive)
VQAAVKSRSLLRWIAVLAVLGIGVSGLALQNHYAKSKTTYCTFGEDFNCDVVNRSRYSEVAGMPVALIGILGYAGLLGLATLYRHKAETPAMLLFCALSGLGFSLYLTWVEAQVLQTWCVLCLSSLLFILLITLLAALELRRQLRGAAA